MNNKNLKKLFDEEYEKMIVKKYARLPMWSWPTGAVYILDSRSNKEREILECIYGKYPEGSHKKQIKKDILSLNSHKFWGAWAELRVYDWISSRGLELKPEPILGTKKPDYLVRYPVGKNAYNELIMEVTTVSAVSQLRQNEEDRIKQLLAKLNEIAVQTNYFFWVHIPTHYFPLPAQINYNFLQESFSNQLNKFKDNQSAKTGFICRTENVKIKVKILGTFTKKVGYIGGYSLGLEDEEEEAEKFIKRAYDKILEKVEKYKKIEELKKPFIIAMLVKDLFSRDAFEKALSNIINLESNVYKRLGGILLYEIIAHGENDGSYTIRYFSTFYHYRNVKYPVDDYFKTLIDDKIDINGANVLKNKILDGEVILS